MSDDLPLPVLVGTVDAARILGVHPQTLRANRGKAYPIPARVGPRRDRRYRVSDLRAYLAPGER